MLRIPDPTHRNDRYFAVQRAHGSFQREQLFAFRALSAQHYAVQSVIQRAVSQRQAIAAAGIRRFYQPFTCNGIGLSER